MSTLLHAILDRAPALATLAQECKGCPGTLCKGCHGTEHAPGCPCESSGDACTRTGVSAPHELGHPCETGQGLNDVVIDYCHGKEHQEDECSLVDAFLDGQADFPLHEAFDEQKEDHATVQYGDG